MALEAPPIASRQPITFAASLFGYKSRALTMMNRWRHGHASEPSVLITLIMSIIITSPSLARSDAGKQVERKPASSLACVESVSLASG